MNLLREASPAALSSRSLSWEHSPAEWAPLPGEGIRVLTPPRVDYFQDPAGTHTNDNAPFLWLAVRGDFVLRARLRPAFTTTYDAGAIMVRHNERRWAKLCYERTDQGANAVVSVVTRDTSDDANGPDLSVPDVWLQIARAGSLLGMHYRMDGSGWRMVRVFELAMPPEVRVGLVAQCPVGPGARVSFTSLEVERRSIGNLRAGG